MKGDVQSSLEKVMGRNILNTKFLNKDVKKMSYYCLTLIVKVWKLPCPKQAHSITMTSR